jgi:hypothetical protein
MCQVQDGCSCGVWLGQVRTRVGRQLLLYVCCYCATWFWPLGASPLCTESTLFANPFPRQEYILNQVPHIPHIYMPINICL